MAEQTDIEELRTAWAALGASPAAEGWTSIVLSAGSRFRAGAAWPGGSETLLVGFTGVTLPPKSELPEGRGFAVRAAPQPAGQGHDVWIALTRQVGGADDLFSRMVADVVDSVAAQSSKGEAWLLTLTLARIRAWQEFMRRPRTGVLPPEAELGLAGELIVLETVLADGVDPNAALESWVGPDGGLQDFQTAVHGLEVKSSLAAGAFPARISSLEQLDDAQGRVILLAAVRFCIQTGGRTLPMIISDLRVRLSAGAGQGSGLFDMRLLQAGYFDRVAADYVRPFDVIDIRVFEMDETFPRLARSAVRPEIREAEYEIDLDLATTPPVSLPNALMTHGVY
jgi:hypothetical protein